MSVSDFHKHAHVHAHTNTRIHNTKRLSEFSVPVSLKGPVIPFAEIGCEFQCPAQFSSGQSHFSICLIPSASLSGKKGFFMDFVVLDGVRVTPDRPRGTCISPSDEPARQGWCEVIGNSALVNFNTKQFAKS